MSPSPCVILISSGNSLALQVSVKVCITVKFFKTHLIYVPLLNNHVKTANVTPTHC